MAHKQKQTRRRNNEGSIYRRKNGKWVGQVTTGYDAETGKPIRAYTYSDNREDVAHWVASTLASNNFSKEVRVRPEELVLKDFLHMWLTRFKTHEVESRTMDQYYSCERLHIVPAIGNVPISQVTTIQIQNLIYQAQLQKGLTQRTLSIIRSTLVQMFDYALSMGMVTNNPARNVKLPRANSRRKDEEEKVFSISEREALLETAEKDPIMSPILTLLMFTGMRIGEALALQWKHIDFEAKTIQIRQSLTREITFDETGKQIKRAEVLGTTKTRNSIRTIIAPDLVFDRLKSWIQYVSTLKGGAKTLVPDGFVFISTRTKGMRTYQGFRASFCHFLDHNGFDSKSINLHRFRHTYASMLLEQDINPKIVQKLLGHSDVSTTLNVYTHVVPEVYKDVAAMMNTVSEQLASGTYAIKSSTDRIQEQLQLLKPVIRDGTAD